jgi:galactokinase
MYCVIQELNLRKADTNGAYKELAAFINPFNYRDIPQYMYSEAGSRFERLIKKAYKISIHESKRQNGVVTKKQVVVTTVNYYALTDDFFALGDYGGKIMDIAVKLNVDANDVYAIIDAKILPLQERIKTEFEQTEEYITRTNHKNIITRYKEEKSLFSQKYGCLDAEYDYCFNVFGELMNESHYNKIKNHSNAMCSYQKKILSNYTIAMKNDDDNACGQH